MFSASPIETEEVFACTECDKVFVHKPDYVRRGHRQVERKHRCDQCCKVFCSQSQFTHMHVHSENAQLQCANCQVVQVQGNVTNDVTYTPFTSTSTTRCLFSSLTPRRAVSMNNNLQMHANVVHKEVKPFSATIRQKVRLDEDSLWGQTFTF